MREKLFNEHAKRFTKNQKQEFRNAVKEYLKKSNYEVIEHKTIYGTNLYFGNINAKYTVTAHYDTATNMALFYPWMKWAGARYGQLLCLVPFLIILEFSSTLYLLIASLVITVAVISLLIPNKYNYNDNTSGVLSILMHAEENKENSDFFYALTDNEEKGLFGAKALKRYLKDHNRKNSRVVNIDCVGIGERLLLVATSNNKYSEEIHKKLGQHMQIDKLISKLLASDHLLFGTNGLMLTRVNNAKLGNDVYIPNLHTNKDREIDFNYIYEIVQALDYIKEV